MRLAWRIFTVTQTKRIARPNSAFVHRLKIRLEHIFANIGHVHGQLARIDRGRPEITRSCWFNQSFIIAMFDLFIVSGIGSVVLECGLEP